jgi:phosphohistidine phosphatase SixA
MGKRRRTFAGVFGPGLLALAACGGSCGSDADYSGAGEPAVTTVYLVRHAEKGAGDDPDLSPRGKLRALALPSALELEHLAAIYSTATKRTQQTAAPVAAVTGIEVTRMPPTDYSGLLERVRSHAGKAVLVVGHSNTVPPMLATLGVRDQVTLEEDDFGDLFIVTVPAQGAATLEMRRFGDQPARPPL